MQTPSPTQLYARTAGMTTALTAPQWRALAAELRAEAANRSLAGERTFCEDRARDCEHRANWLDLQLGGQS